MAVAVVKVIIEHFEQGIIFFVSNVDKQALLLLTHVKDLGVTGIRIIELTRF